MSNKTNKSFTKRLKVSKPKSGKAKLLSRKPGFNHFNAKASGTTRQQGRKTMAVSRTAKELQQHMPHHNV
jgi:ribosomal protein L35